MAGITIHIDHESTDLDLAAIAAMIAVLRGQNIPNAGPAPSPAPLPVSVPGTSVTVRDAPAATQTVSQLIGDAAVDVSIPLPPAPPVAADPPAAPPPPVTSGAPVTLDKDGIPWDARIHSSSRNKTAKGVWQRKRNTDDPEWERVRAELRQAMSAGAPPAPIEALIAALPTPPAMPDPAAAFATPVAPQSPAPTASPAVAATIAADTAPPPAVMPAPPAPTSGDPFGTFLVKVTAAQDAGQLTVAQCQAAAQSFGLSGLRDLHHRHDMIPAVEMALFG